MKAIFNTLFSVQFLHEYFSAAAFEGLQTKPDSETRKLLLKNGFVFRAYGGGFSILYDSCFGGTQRSLNDVLSDSVTCCFLVTLTDPHFYIYTTDFGADISVFHFLFSNAGGIGCPDEKGANLHRDAYVCNKELAVAENGSAGLFGKIIITVSKGLQPQYYIRFAQRRTYLRYFLVTPYFLTLDQPAIIDTGNQQKFSRAANVTLSNGKKAILFISENEVGFANKARSAFNLVENYEQATGKYKLVKSQLPLPDVRAISKALDEKAPAGKFYSDIFL